MNREKITSSSRGFQQVITSYFSYRLLVCITLLSLTQAAYSSEQSEKSIPQLIGQNIRVGPQMVGSIIASHNIEIEGSEVKNKVIAGKSVVATNCHVQGNIVSGKHIVLSNCPKVNLVTAGQDITLINTTAQEIKSGGQVTLNKAIVQGNATSGRGAAIKDSQIRGMLTTATNHLILDNSQVSRIQLHPVGGVNQNTFGISVRSGQGSSLVNVSNGSVSSVNGYTIKGMIDKTIVITPEGTLYINGKKISGMGPESYSTYRQQNPKAPVVNGPGWHNANSEISLPMDNNAPFQKVELRNGSNVSEDILFEGGHGQVIVYPGSQFSGIVHGGVIINR